MIEIKKNYFVIARLYVKPEFSERELMKNKEKIHVNCSSALQSAKFTSLTRYKVLMKVENALNFRVQDMNRTPHHYTRAFIITLISVMSYCV